MKYFLALLAITALLLTSCTIDKFQGEFPIEAEVLTMGATIVSIRYKIGVSEVYDDLTMKEKPAILTEWKHKDLSVIPLKVVMSGKSDDGGNSNAEIKYFYKSNLVCTSKSFDFDSIRMMATDNGTLFTWEYKDGNLVNNKKEEPEPVKTETPAGKVGVGKGETL